ncbi:MAG: MFS transporter [Porticoccaceae bacterium]|nr:MAG: MFS transporter [Porticoccaceae bacterium]
MPPSHRAVPDAAPERWYALGVLFGVSVLNTVDKSLVPALAAPLQREFQLSDAEFGLLAGTIFSTAYALAAIPLGLLIDRVERTRLLAALLGLWSFFTLLGARAGSFFELALCRLGVAAAESGGNPTSLALIADYFPPRERGRAVAIFSTNAALASLFTFSAAGLLAERWGWRGVFMAASIPGFLLAILILVTLRDPGRRPNSFQTPTDDALTPGIRSLLRTLSGQPRLLWILIGAIFAIAVQAGCGAFITAFFVRVHEFSLAQAGIASGLVLSFGFAIGTVAGGFLTDRKPENPQQRAADLAARTALLATPFGLVAFLAPNPSAALAMLFTFQLFASCYYGLSLRLLLDLSPQSVRGATMTYLTLVLNLGGYGLGPLITGILSDAAAGQVAEPLRAGLAGTMLMLPLAAYCFRCASARLAVAAP